MRLADKFFVALGLLALPLSLRAADFAVLSNGFSIRHERREVRGQITRLYVDAKGESYVDVPTDQIERFERDLSPGRAGDKSQQDHASLSEMIDGTSSNFHLDPDLVNSVIHAESGFNVRAVSRKGAQGLMQLMPQTASQLGVENAFDPQANVKGGTRYLRELLERYNFDLIKALAAYNAGPQRVEQYRGVPPYYETQAYVARIVRDFNRKKLAERKVAKHAALNPAAARRSTPPSTNALHATSSPVPLSSKSN